VTGFENRLSLVVLAPGLPSRAGYRLESASGQDMKCPAAVLLLFILLACVARAVSAGDGVYRGDFRTQLPADWRTLGGKWEIKEGRLAQTHTGQDDPIKAIFVAISRHDAKSDLVITAKVRIDAMPKNGDGRAGISVCCDPRSGRGLNLVFHGGKLQWLHDFVVWGPSCPFSYETGKWYWLKLSKSHGDPTAVRWIDEGKVPGVLKGKAWPDGQPEPADWMLWWSTYDDTLGGHPGLNGGSTVSFASFTVERVARSKPAMPREQYDLPLNGTWQVRSEPMGCIGEEGLRRVESAMDGWISSRVPGEIHLDLIRAGRMPEPAVGVNMPRCRWPETKSWWYRTTFDLPADRLDYERQQLVFDGIDLYGQVFLNGKMLGESANALIPAAFDTKRRLRPGRNMLVVRVTAGSELSHDPAAAGGKIPNPEKRNWESGRIWLRKPAFSYGWDWVDALPNIGIWRGVRLENRRHVVLNDLRMDTLRKADTVYLEMEAVLENLHSRSERACVLELEIQPPDKGSMIARRYPVDLMPGRHPVGDLIEVPHPRLWWPNGMGEQPLYRIVAQVKDGSGTVCDRREFFIGLRTIDIDRSRLPEGSRFCFRVNGQEVFARGGNIGPQDPILARTSDAKYRKLVAEAKRANMNMIRINGCSIYEQPAFYDACDRAGILIFHDFMLTERTFPENDARFAAAVRAEIETVVPQLRSHPSIALWCGNNEASWFNLENPGEGQKFYNEMFPDLCRQLDPHRPYWQGSPAGGRNPNDEMSGDCHWWFSATMNQNMERRVRHEVYDECRSRFLSEYGIIGPCHLDSIREYLSPEEMHPGHPAWKLHTNEFERDTLAAGIRCHYADTEKLSVPEYVKFGQMFQAIMHGNAMQAQRFRKHDPVNDCAGALIWSYSDCWGETGWSILDYYLRRKASYYWMRRACAPVKAVVRRRGERLITRVLNDTLKPVTATLETGWWRLDGGARETNLRRIQVNANEMLEATAVALSADPHDPARWAYAALLRSGDGTAFDQSICLLEPYRKLALQVPRIKAEAVSDHAWQVSSSVFVHAVHVEDHGRELFSDNWFDLLPNVPLRVEVPAGYSVESAHWKAVMPVPSK
jgi:beta-mannosidase